jgi:hypothetical protein
VKGAAKKLLTRQRPGGAPRSSQQQRRKGVVIKGGNLGEPPFSERGGAILQRKRGCLLLGCCTALPAAPPTLAALAQLCPGVALRDVHCTHTQQRRSTCTPSDQPARAHALRGPGCANNAAVSGAVAAQLAWARMTWSWRRRHPPPAAVARLRCVALLDKNASFLVCLHPSVRSHALVVTHCCAH